MNAETPARDTGWWRALADAPPLAILAIGWFVLAVYAYPGQMSWDSLEYMHAMRHGFYTDAHPPAMSGVWSVTELFIAGPSGMFLLQSIAFISGLYLAMRKTFAPRAAAWAATALTIFPPVMLPMAVIWEHSLMASLLMLGFGALLSIQRRINVLGLVAIGVAIAVHPTARVAAFPLVVLLFDWPAKKTFLRRYGVAVGAWLAMTVLAASANWLLTDQKLGRIHAERDLFDVAGVLKYSHGDRPDADVQRLLAGTGLRVDQSIQSKIRERYRPRDVTTLLVGQNAIWDMPLYGEVPVPDEQREAIERAWEDLALGNPAPYLRHRLQVMKRLLGIVGRDRPPAVLPRNPASDEIMLGVGLPTRSSELQDTMTDAAQAVADYTPLFWPWIYVVLGFVLLPFARDYRDVVALLASGLALEATLFFTAIENSYRQSHWMIVCVCVAFVAVLARRHTWTWIRQRKKVRT